jgi:hypothetical protein
VKTFTLPSGAAFTVPDFRGSVPLYSPPDRAAWIAAGHDVPRTIDADLPPKFASRARAALALDAVTLDFEAAVRAQTTLDAVCDAVKYLPESYAADDDLVYFDPEDGRFWIYPA